MPEIPAGYGQAQAIIRLPGDNELMTIGQGFKLAGEPTFSSVEADFFSTAWAAAIKPTMTQAYAYDGCTFIVGLPFGDVEFSSGAGAGPGAVNQPALPSNSAVLVKKRSGLAGRTNRGRCFVPGVPEQNVDELGVLLTAFFNTIQTNWSAFRVAVEAHAEFDGLSILHAPLSVETPTAITAMVIDQRIATQRRRLR